MVPKVYKAGEVCELVQVQPYVLRSWEKEFPGIGIQKTPDSPRLYRQSDLEHVQRIKQLVFNEGLTVSGVRRRLEESAPPTKAAAAEVAEVLDAMGADARSRITRVRDGLREIRTLLTGAPARGNGTSARVGGQAVKRASAGRMKAQPAAQRAVAARRGVAVKPAAPRKKALSIKRKRPQR